MVTYPVNFKIPDAKTKGFNNNDLESCFRNDNHLKLLDNIMDFWGSVCFNYALDNKDIRCCSDAHDILEENYIPIELKDAQKGDIISYYEDEPLNYNALHFAKIWKTKGTFESTIVRSKWGSMGVFESTIDNMFDCYGNIFLIWRKKS